MKNIKFSLDDNDIKAISCALSVLPSYDFFDSFPPQLISMPTNIILKLHQKQHLDNQSLYLIAIAVDSAYKALRDEITVEQDAVSELRPFLFSINKLFPVFSPLLDDER